MISTDFCNDFFIIENWSKVYLHKVEAKNLGKKLIFCYHLESQRRKEQDPDPYQNVTNLDP